QGGRAGFTDDHEVDPQGEATRWAVRRVFRGFDTTGFPTTGSGFLSYSLVSRYWNTPGRHVIETVSPWRRAGARVKTRPSSATASAWVGSPPGQGRAEGRTATSNSPPRSFGSSVITSVRPSRVSRTPPAVVSGPKSIGVPLGFCRARTGSVVS